MKIALIGFGNMGRAVARIAQEREHELAALIDTSAADATHSTLTKSALHEADIAIDFTLPDSAIENAKICNEAHTPLVMGTTGWYDRIDEMRDAVKEIGFLWSSNFSIGVNVYFSVVEAAAKLMNNFDEYDVWGNEIHHHNKADSPSGTAKTLGQILLREIERKTAVVEEKLDRRIEPHELHFSSTRGGPVNFAHTIGFDSAADTITLTHNARNRDGYALGAVKAAEWLIGADGGNGANSAPRKGFFNMKDFLAL